MRRLIGIACVLMLLIALPASAQITMEWDPAPNATSYIVYGSLHPDAPQWAVDVGAVTTWAYTSGTSGTTYYFWVATRLVAGDEQLLSPYQDKPLSSVYEGTTTTPPPPPPPPGGDPTPPPPPPDLVPSPPPVLMPPADSFVDQHKNAWALTLNEWGGSAFLNGGYLTHADQLNLRDVGVTMRQGANWLLWDQATKNWLAAGTTEPSAPTPPVEICGDKIDNDGDGQIDEEDAGCLPEPPPPPSPPDPCMETPLKVTVSSWPNPAPGRRRPDYTSSHELRMFTFALGTSTTRSATFTDTRGCTVMVK